MAYIQGLTGGAQPVIVLGDLEFNEIKSSLKSFFQSTDKFTDYDFEGSALSTLMDMLAYNTTFFSYYANMIANESFLDTALNFKSVSQYKP